MLGFWGVFGCLWMFFGLLAVESCRKKHGVWVAQPFVSHGFGGFLQGTMFFGQQGKLRQEVLVAGLWLCQDSSKQIWLKGKFLFLLFNKFLFWGDLQRKLLAHLHKGCPGLHHPQAQRLEDVPVLLVAGDEDLSLEDARSGRLGTLCSGALASGRCWGVFLKGIAASFHPLHTARKREKHKSNQKTSFWGCWWCFLAFSMW